MIGLDYFLLGYFTVAVEEKQKGSALELLLQKGISARYSKKSGLTVKQKHRKKVLEALSNTGISISKNRGLPDFLYRNRRKYGLFIGFFVCLILYFLSSGRIWDIRVRGVCNEESERVISALAEQGVQVGAAFRDFDFSRVESSLLSKCPTLSWVNLNRRGTVMYAEVILKEESNPGAAAGIGNIVASEDAVVFAVSPDSGVACIKVGEAVKKGALLISAVHPDGTLSGASGEVLGCVSGSLTAVAAREESQTVIERERLCSVRIKILNFSVNIFKNYRNLSKDCDIIESERRVRLFGRYALPISVYTSTAYQKKSRPVLYSEAQTVALASARLRSALSDLLLRGELRSLRTEGEWMDGGYSMRVYYEQIRSIGRWEPIQTENQG